MARKPLVSPRFHPRTLTEGVAIALTMKESRGPFGGTQTKLRGHRNRGADVGFGERVAVAAPNGLPTLRRTEQTERYAWVGRVASNVLLVQLIPPNSFRDAARFGARSEFLAAS